MIDMKYLWSLLLVLLSVPTSLGQIGYQVSLLNNATGEPRTNESVNVVVRISDSDGGVICEQTKQETTNDFGVLSMTVGDSGTFQNADWSKLPFFIEASVDGRLIGKSQILSVPIAEHARHTGELTLEKLCSKIWKYEYDWGAEKTLKFYEDGTFVETMRRENESETHKGYIEIDGNLLFLYYNTGEDDGMLLRYSAKRNDLLRIYGGFSLK